jgi:ABC-type nitrate/sulfonate/bicarbonate transport system permease component
MTFLRQQVMRRRLQQFVARLTTVQNQKPSWRHLLAGYLAGLMLVGFGLGIGLVETRLLSSIFFPGVLLLFSASVVALVWGLAQRSSRSC